MKCRLCIIECFDDNSFAIFNKEGESNLTKLIVKYLYFEITQYDEFSTKICFDCKRHLEEFHEFFEKVENSQRILLTSKDEEGFEHHPNVAIEKKSSNFELIEESEIELNDEIESIKTTPTEAEEFQFADDKSDVSSILSKTEQLLAPKIPTTNKNSKKCKSQKTAKAQKTLALEKKKRGRPRKANKTGSTIDANGATEIKSSEELQEPKNMLSPAEERAKDDFIAKNIELKCEICGEVMLAFKKFRSHFRKQHKRRAFITCCGLRFTQRWRLIDHIRLHVDPNHFKCKYCDKTLTTQLGYENHLLNYHGDKKRKKHKCEICEKRFSLRASLKVHMVVHKRVVDLLQCDLCDKGFKTTIGLRQHKQFLHGEKTCFICHICGKECKTKSILETHIAQVHNGIPKSKCSYCDKWVSTSYLKKHEQYHIPKEVECDECGKIFPSEGALRGHKRGLSHKERTLNCTYCDKSFKEKRFLKEHIAIHTGQKDYMCKYCQKEFRSKLNMGKHVRQQHVAEYEKEKAQKNFGNTVESTELACI